MEHPSYRVVWWVLWFFHCCLRWHAKTGFNAARWFGVCLMLKIGAKSSHFDPVFLRGGKKSYCRHYNTLIWHIGSFMTISCLQSRISTCRTVEMLWKESIDLLSLDFPDEKILDRLLMIINLKEIHAISECWIMT